MVVRIGRRMVIVLGLIGLNNRLQLAGTTVSQVRRLRSLLLLNILGLRRLDLLLHHVVVQHHILLCKDPRRSHGLPWLA